MAGWRGRGWTEGKEAEEETRGVEGEGDHDGVKEGGRCAVEWAQEGTGKSSLNCTRNRPLAASGGGEEKQRQGRNPRAPRPGAIGGSGTRSQSRVYRSIRAPASPPGPKAAVGCGELSPATRAPGRVGNRHSVSWPGAPLRRAEPGHSLLRSRGNQEELNQTGLKTFTTQTPADTQRPKNLAK